MGDRGFSSWRRPNTTNTIHDEKLFRSRRLCFKVCLTCRAAEQSIILQKRVNSFAIAIVISEFRPSLFLFFRWRTPAGKSIHQLVWASRRMFCPRVLVIWNCLKILPPWNLTLFFPQTYLVVPQHIQKLILLYLMRLISEMLPMFMRFIPVIF